MNTQTKKVSKEGDMMSDQEIRYSVYVNTPYRGAYIKYFDTREEAQDWVEWALDRFDLYTYVGPIREV